MNGKFVLKQAPKMRQIMKRMQPTGTKPVNGCDKKVKQQIHENREFMCQEPSLIIKYQTSLLDNKKLVIIKNHSVLRPKDNVNTRTSGVY